MLLSYVDLDVSPMYSHTTPHSLQSRHCTLYTAPSVLHFPIDFPDSSWLLVHIQQSSLPHGSPPHGSGLSSILCMVIPPLSMIFILGSFMSLANSSSFFCMALANLLRGVCGTNSVASVPFSHSDPGSFLVFLLSLFFLLPWLFLLNLDSSLHAGAGLAFLFVVVSLLLTGSSPM